jgi:peptidyl-dipeptidase Dcp
VRTLVRFTTVGLTPLILLLSLTMSHSTAALPTESASNSLLRPWSGPYGGVPPFDQIKVAEFPQAFTVGMQEQLADIARITDTQRAATFDNTIAALERSGRTLDRVYRLFGIYGSTLKDDQVQAIESEWAPKLAQQADLITQNTALFKRVEAVYTTREHSQLSAEQKRLTWVVYTNFVRSGAQLDAPAKEKLSALNQQLATLYTQFSQRLLNDENEHWLALKSEADFAGLPDSVRAGLIAGAEARGIDALGAVLNTRSSVEPFLEYSTRRDLRETVWRTFIGRGDQADKNNTKDIITQILALRAERAQLLGFKTHAHWRLEDSMAKTPEHAMALMESVWPAAVARVREEVADMQAVADQRSAREGTPAIRLEAWDYRYYAELVREQKYDLDSNKVKPYLQLEKLREGMFWVAGQLFGFYFKEVPAGQVPVAHPDIRVFEVTNAAHEHVGLWYFDPYARPNKESGAWMNEYRSQERFLKPVTTIVSNNSNFVKGKPGEPVLISWEDATTLFHEFGHALHGLSSHVTYPTLAGTSVARDYVEFPSQLLEHWLSTPEVLNRFALHVDTGQPMPAALVQKIHSAATFNQGFKTVEYLSSALIDMKLHLSGKRVIDPDTFEAETLAALGMPREIVMRHRTPQFGHIFSSDGYSAGYYSYLWADTLSTDAWEAFMEAGGAYDPAVAKRLREHVFMIGNTEDPADAYRAFRGRDPGTSALMRHRGFPVKETHPNTPK